MLGLIRSHGRVDYVGFHSPLCGAGVISSSSPCGNETTRKFFASPLVRKKKRWRTALLALALTATSLPSLSAQNVPDLAGRWTLLGIVERGRFTPSTWTNEYSQHIEIVQEGMNMTMIRRWPNGMTTVRPFLVGTTTTFSDGLR